MLSAVSRASRGTRLKILHRANKAHLPLHIMHWAMRFGMTSAHRFDGGVGFGTCAQSAAAACHAAALRLCPKSPKFFYYFRKASKIGCGIGLACLLVIAAAAQRLQTICCSQSQT